MNAFGLTVSALDYAEMYAEWLDNQRRDIEGKPINKDKWAI